MATKAVVKPAAALAAVEPLPNPQSLTPNPCCSLCNWWRPHSAGATGNCIAEPPRILVQVPSQVPVYYAEEIPLALRGSQFCIHPATAAAECCRLFQLKEIMP
jgi:hypothetical protein